MNESIEFFDGPPSFSDLVDRVMRKYGCRVDEISLRGRFDCGKARAHYVLMKLASDANWKHYKDVVHEANVACLEVTVEIVRMPGPNVVMREEVAVVNHNGTQKSEMLHHVLGETERDFDLAIANDDFPNNIFERDEANIDVDNVSMGSEDCELEEDGVVGVEDISMVHKAICESSMVNAEGTSIGESPVIKKGMKFNSLEELKFFLADYAVRLHRPFSVVHSDKNLRYNVMCKQGCHWRVWSRLISSTGQWRISNVVQPHTCRSSQPKREHVQCTAKYLGWRILGIIRKDSETSVPSLVESIFIFSGYRVKYSKAWRAKQHVVALLWGDWKESYGMVPRVLSAITYYNPGVKWCIDSCGMMLPDNGVLKHILQRVFWCFAQCSEVFQHCRPVILVDSTFLTGKYKGTLMMAVAVDPEQQLVPLAFALAESENNESWSWFMKLVRLHVLGPSRIVCMISDRHHGLLNGAKDHIDAMASRRCSSHVLSCVEWKPYDREQLSHIVFSPTCYRDRELWRCTTPLILYYVVEFHMPHRVMRQFGRMQPCPPLELSTSQQLHSIDRRKRYKENDWRLKHGQYLLMWQNKQGCDPEGGPYWRPNNEYIRWYCTSMRTKVKPSWTNVPIEDAPSESDADITDAIVTLITHGMKTPAYRTTACKLSNEAA
uniref:MULE transposase domain-containing protein n=1 Tax=Setaria italica TaxID=4555 RepID=K3Z2Z6_SETIT